jgi:hypothetical protein
MVDRVSEFLGGGIDQRLTEQVNMMSNGIGGLIRQRLAEWKGLGERVAYLVG